MFYVFWPVKPGVLNSVCRQIIYVNGYSSLTFINRIFYYEQISEYSFTALFVGFLRCLTVFAGSLKCLTVFVRATRTTSTWWMTSSKQTSNLSDYNYIHHIVKSDRLNVIRV